MVRPVLRLCVLWALLVLLPLRGLAAGFMLAESLPTGQGGAVAPCHALDGVDAGEAPQPGGMAPSGEDGAGLPALQASPDVAGSLVDSHSALCGDCELCHAPMASPTSGLGLAPFPFSDAPPKAHPRDTGRLMASWLERPPRR